MNSIEAGRVEIGLTRTQALGLIGSTSGSLSILTRYDSDLDPQFHERMRHAVDAYRLWVRGMVERLDARAVVGNYPLSMLELSALTGVREVNLIALRSRGTLRGVLVPGRSGMEYVYPVESVRDFIRTNSTVLTTGRSKSRGHLAAAFMRHYAQLIEPYPTAPIERELVAVG